MMNLKKFSLQKLLFLGVLGIAIIFQVNCHNTSLYIGPVSKPEGDGMGITIIQEIQQFTEYSTVGYMYSDSPTFMVMNSEEDIIYAVNELTIYENVSGTLSAYRIDSGGNLTLLNLVHVLGSRPCHLTVDPSGKYVLIASCSTGNVEVYQILKNGAIGSQTSNVYAPTKVPNTASAQAHMVIFEPTHQHVAVAFQGLDMVYFYNLDARGVLTAYNIALKDGSLSQVRAELANGSGPRHLVYSLNGRYFYVICEFSSTIATFSAQLNSKDGTFPALQTVPMHSKDYNGGKRASEIAVHPNGKYLFASDRGDNVIVTYSIEASTGHLTLLPYHATSITPRHFIIDPSGVVLYAANQDADTIDIFEINDDGSLSKRDYLANVKSPASILFKQVLTGSGSTSTPLNAVYFFFGFALILSTCKYV